MFSAKALSLFSLLFKESVDSRVLQRVQNQQCGRNQKTRIEFERCELMHSTRNTQDWSSVIEKPSQKTSSNICFFQTADKLIRTFAEQIFYTGFIHADPHPGNGWYDRKSLLVFGISDKGPIPSVSIYI